MNKIGKKVLLPLCFTITVAVQILSQTKFLGIIFIALLLLFYTQDGKISITKAYNNRFLHLYELFLIYALIITTIFMLFGFNTKTESFLNIYIYRYLLFGIMIIVVASNADLDAWVTFIKILALFLSILGLFEGFFKINPTLNFLRDATQNQLLSLGRVMSVFGHPNIYGCFLSIALFYIIYKPFKSVILQTVSVVLVVINILLTQSRSASLAVVVVFIALMLKKIVLLFKSGKSNTINLSKAFLYFFALCLVCIVVVFFWNNVQSIIYRILNKVQSSSVETESIRFDTINNYIDYARQPGNFLNVLFGKGIGYSVQFMNEHPVGHNGYWNVTTDNNYITLLLDVGIIGTAVFIYLLLFAIKHLIKTSNIHAISIVLISIEMFSYESFGWYAVLFLYLISAYFLFDESATNERVLKRRIQWKKV